MIMYFTGTGNSKYVADRIASALGDTEIDLLERLQNRDYRTLDSDRPWVIVTPTYGWQIPHILRDWLQRTELRGNKDIYFVMTCGSDIGNAEAHVRKLCELKDLEFRGCAAVVMPENYIAMYDAPKEPEARDIIHKAEPRIDQIIGRIRKGKNFPRTRAGSVDRLKSSIINRTYYPVLVHSKKFYATDACIGCGLCEKQCPCGTIEMIDGKPFWSDPCTHCMACICHCPTHAIEYGRISVGKPRYTCPAKVRHETR